MASPYTGWSYALAAEAGPYDERSLLPEDLDIALTIGRSDRPQPFHLICQHDTVLVAMAGTGRVEFAEGSVRWFDYALGDVVYVPAGMPHRIVPGEVSVHHRFKLPESELEGVAFCCEGCGHELHRRLWSLADELPQEGYLRGCQEFNEDAGRRKCTRCGDERPPVDLDGYRWQEIARAQRAQGGA